MSLWKKSESPEATDEWKLYERGVAYNRRLGLYETVDEAEAFFAGDQWRGVDAGGLPTPVFNIFKRIGNYFISQILSQRVKLQYSPDGIPTVFAGGVQAAQPGSLPYDMTSPQTEAAALWQLCEILNRYVDYRWEKDKLQAKLGDVLRDAAVTGDGCLYVYWDPDIRTGQAYAGDFVTVTVDNVNVHMGDPNNPEIERQPYILISGRDTVENLQKEARTAKSPDTDKLAPDTEDRQNESGDLSQYELADTKATYVVKFWRDEDSGTIHWKKSTRTAVIRRDTDLRIRRYPVVYMNWDKRKNCWHGRGFVEGQIQNQLMINKFFALLFAHLQNTSFSTILYDSTKIDQWKPGIGEAIPVMGDVNGAVKPVGVGNLQSGYLDALNLSISSTRDFLGASDAALGNVKPDNTSAILAVQQASAVPLENVKRNLYQMVEDLGLVWLEYILHYYDDGRMLPYRESDDSETIEARPADISRYRDQLFDVRVDVGPSYYWSELSSITSLDNLLKAGAIDIIQYLERIPDQIIPKRRELLEEKRQEKQAANPPGSPGAGPAGSPNSAGPPAAPAQGSPNPEQVLASLPDELRKRLLALPEDEQRQAMAEIMAK